MRGERVNPDSYSCRVSQINIWVINGQIVFDLTDIESDALRTGKCARSVRLKLQ